MVFQGTMLLLLLLLHHLARHVFMIADPGDVAFEDDAGIRFWLGSSGDICWASISTKPASNQHQSSSGGNGISPFALCSEAGMSS